MHNQIPRIRLALAAIKTSLRSNKRLRHIYHECHWMCHCSYFLAIVVGAKGIYVGAAGALALLTVLGLLYATEGDG